MTEEGHPDVPESIFDEEDRTVERQWHIFLNAVQPAQVYCVNHALYNEGYKDDLDELDLIPESIQLHSVSFYYRGTYRDAYLAAQRKCDELNKERDLDGSEWEFERGSIMRTQ